MGRSWQLQEAKNRLSELIDKVHREGPQRVTRRGKEVAVVISPEQFGRLAGPREDLVTFLSRSPLADFEFEAERDRSAFRAASL